MTDLLTKYDKEGLFVEFIHYLENKVTEEREGLFVPLSIFTSKLTPFETIVKYLVEAQMRSYAEIGRLFQKDRQVIWTTYQRSKKKVLQKFLIRHSSENIPLSILQQNKLSVFEIIVAYLKDELEMKNKDIALVLKKDERTIWTVYSRAKKKNAK
ncbi:MAG: hypothetical protein KKF44_01205 [Nanoarchaeota archaeon]|nr:hypothetical protein [Nanoarchaeota archaeon]